jgi:hypothetical protein
MPHTPTLTPDFAFSWHLWLFGSVIMEPHNSLTGKTKSAQEKLKIGIKANKREK